jgi:hypothetical protein
MPPIDRQLANSAPAGTSTSTPLAADQSIAPPPQATALHANRPVVEPPAPVAGPAERHDALSQVDRDARAESAALTPVRDSPDDGLLSPPSRRELTEQFGPQPLLPVADEVDPRVAVAPKRLTGSAFALPPRGEFPVPIQPLAPALLPARGSAAGPVTDLAQAPSDQLLAAVWKQIGGKTIFDQIKTVLALIGALALALVFWRSGNHREREHDEE